MSVSNTFKLEQLDCGPCIVYEWIGSWDSAHHKVIGKVELRDPVQLAESLRAFAEKLREEHRAEERKYMQPTK